MKHTMKQMLPAPTRLPRPLQLLAALAASGAAALTATAQTTAPPARTASGAIRIENPQDKATLATRIDEAIQRAKDKNAAPAKPGTYASVPHRVGQAQQATFVARRHIGQREQQRYLARGGVYAADAAGPLGHPDEVVGPPGQLPNRSQIAGQGRGRNRGGAHRDRGQRRGLGRGQQYGET